MNRYSSWEPPAWIAVLAAATIARLWHLGARVMTHDESLHAYYSYQLYSEGVYRHDPVYHGPLLYHLNAVVYYLFGATDFTARLVPALLGVAIVASMWLLRGFLGRAVAILAAALLSLSPTLLFYSRHIREDVYVALFTILWAYAAFRYVGDRHRHWLFAMTASMAGSFISKETSFIFGTVIGVFFVVLALVPARSDEEIRVRRAAARVAVLMLTLALPFVSGLAYFLAGWQPDNQGTAGALALARAAVVLALFVASAIIAAAVFRIGATAQRHPDDVSFATWVKLMALFWGITITFFTGFFTNVLGGITSGIVGSLGYWLTQQEVRRAGQPWFYYGVLALMYEFLPLLLAAGALIVFARRARARTRDLLFVAFTVWWAVASWILYAWAGEKMPWLLVHQILPVYLLAAWALVALVGELRAQPSRKTSWIVAGGVAAAIVLIVSLLRASPFAGRDVAATAATAAWFVRALLLVGVIALVGRHVRSVGVETGWRLAAVGVLIVAGVLTLRITLQLNFVNYDLATELMSYAQASPDVKRVIRDIETLSVRTVGERQIEVAYDDDSTWPLVWYLRDYPNARTWGTDASLARSAPVILVGPKNRVALQPHVSQGYKAQRSFLYWWPIQDYERITPAGFLSSLRDPAFRGYLWNVFFYRDYGVPIREWPIRREFDFYVRDDVAAQVPANGLAIGGAAHLVAGPEDDVVLQPDHIVAGVFAGLPLSGPTAISVASDGARLIADSGNHRVVVLERDGSLRHVIANARFNEPWGVAAGPQGEVFVSDTWNGAIQVFDSRGTFRRKWGTFGQPVAGEDSSRELKLYGPRGLTIDDAGRLIVADTGNKRLLLFDTAGTLLSEIGPAAPMPEFFNEPTAVAADSNGTLLIADAWNQRIVRADKHGRTLSAWPVAGWSSNMPDDKPFLAVDGSGFVYATDPSAGTIMVFAPAGKPLRHVRITAADGSRVQPTGIAVDLDERTLLVSDRAGNRLLVLPVDRFHARK